MTRRMLRALNRLRYRLEKGNQYILGLGVLVGILFALMFSSAVVLSVTGEQTDFLDAVWWSFLRLSDPGYLGDDDGYVRRTLGIMLWFGGVFGITAFLISITTHIVSTKLEQISEFGSEVAFDDHTLIVGWNEKLFTLVEELLEADPHVEIAILAPLPKQEAELELDKRVFSEFTERRFDPRRQVVYRSGSAQSDVDLRRVGADRARATIVLTAAGERGLSADVANLRTCMALRRFREDGDGEKPPLSTVLEITDGRFRAHALLAGHLDPRSDAWVAADLANGRLSHLPAAKGPESGEVLTLVNSDELVSRAIAQCAIQPRLSRVLEELFSFQGKEFFLARPGGAAWDRLVENARDLEPDQLPAYLASALEDGLICGVYEESEVGGGTVDFSPEGLYEGFATKSLVVLAETQAFRAAGLEPKIEPRLHVEHHPVDPVHFDPPLPEHRQYRVLLLGSNRRVPVLIEQFGAFTAQYEELDLHLTLVSTELDEGKLRAAAARSGHLPADSVVMLREDYTDWGVLGPLLRPDDAAEPGRSFDSIVLLAQDCDLSGEDVDAQVILGVVMLRAFRSDPRWEPFLEGTSVVAELLDPRNVDIVGTEDWIADVIVSSQYVSRFIAQVSMDHRVEDVYCELLDYGGREIYDRRAADYLSTELTFQEAMTSAAARGEVAFGFTVQRSDGAQPEIYLAPDVRTRIDPGARLLVIAED